MPRTKLDTKTSPLMVLILGTAAAKGISQYELADMIGVAPATICNRKKKPEDFTLAQLRKLRTGLGIPIEELRNAAIK